MSDAPNTSDWIISAKAVQDKTSLSRTTIWRLTRKRDFPQPVRLSENRIGYSLRAVESWLASRMEHDPK